MKKILWNDVENLYGFKFYVKLFGHDMGWYRPIWIQRQSCKMKIIRRARVFLPQKQIRDQHKVQTPRFGVQTSKLVFSLHVSRPSILYFRDLTGPSAKLCQFTPDMHTAYERFTVKMRLRTITTSSEFLISLRDGDKAFLGHGTLKKDCCPKWTALI